MAQIDMDERKHMNPEPNRPTAKHCCIMLHQSTMVTILQTRSMKALQRQALQNESWKSMHTGKPAKMSAFVDFHCPPRPAWKNLLMKWMDGRGAFESCPAKTPGQAAWRQFNPTECCRPGVSNLTFFPHCFPSFGVLGGLWKDPLQAVGTVLVICVEVFRSLWIWQDFVKMRLGLRLGQSMHVGSFSPGRAGEKLGNSESQVCLWDAFACICKMCTLYVQSAYY